MQVRGGTIYGRIVGFAGEPYRGEYPHLVFSTPYGSKLTAGRFWFKPLDAEGQLKLVEHERLATEVGAKTLYPLDNTK